MVRDDGDDVTVDGDGDDVTEDHDRIKTILVTTIIMEAGGQHS